MSHSINRYLLETAAPISKQLVRALQQLGPLRLRKRNQTPFSETLCRVIAGQQLSTKAAATIWGRLVASAATEETIGFVARCDDDELRACGLSKNKAKAMKAVAVAEHQGLLEVRALARLNHQDRSDQLTQIYGVGQWTADMISIFYFGEKDVWPANDVTANNTLDRLTTQRHRPIETAARFAPRRTYLALAMYQIADTNPDL